MYLELVPDMTSPAFFRAFKQFSSRRGSSDVTLSDNLKTFESAEIKCFSLQNNMEQKFVFLVSPWRGGF